MQRCGCALLLNISVLLRLASIPGRKRGDDAVQTWQIRKRSSTAPQNRQKKNGGEGVMEEVEGVVEEVEGVVEDVEGVVEEVEGVVEEVEGVVEVARHLLHR